LNMRAKMPMLTIASPAEPEPPFLPPTEQQEGGMSLAQVFAIVWAHRKLSLIITVALAVVFATYIKFLPKSYNATAVVMVNYEANDPLLGEQAFPAGLMDSYIATQIAVIQSASVMGPVIGELELTKNKEFMAGYNGGGSEADWAKAQLLKKLIITHPNYTQLIYISAESLTAVDAALLANTVAKVYLSQQQDRLNTPATERANKYAEQLSGLKEKVAAAQQKVTEFRERNGLTDVAPDNNDVEVALLNSLEHQYQDAVNAERAIMVSQQSQQDVTKAAAQSGVVQALRGQLANLQAKMAEYKITYGPSHPKVIELQSQIDSAKSGIDNEMRSLSNSSTVDLTTIRDLASKLKIAVDSQRTKVLARRRQQDDGGKLLLELESAQAVYQRALDGYDKVIAAAGGQSSNLRLMDSAEVPVKSTKPNKMKLLIMALAASMFFGLAGPFAYDFLLKRKVRCREDVEHDLGMPVLAEFDTCPALLAEAP
jgi:succinoglycan biosynthesis transport protein ExoP